MGGLYSRIKNWLSLQNLNDTDLNAEFNNIIANSKATGLGGYSATIPQMQITKAPGDVGTENQALSVADEIAELRYQIKALSGGAQWYVPPTTSISALSALFSSLSTLPNNRIVSGRQYTSLQPGFLVPNGSNNSVTLQAGVTPLVTVIQGTTTTFHANTSLTGLNLAPASSNTAIVTDATLSGSQSTKTQGERGTIIQIGTVGGNISTANGKYAAFKIGTEYFIGEISANANPFSPTFAMQGVVAGASVTATAGVGIPAATTISSVNATGFVMSANSTVAGTVNLGLTVSGVGYPVVGTVAIGSPNVTNVISTGVVTATANGVVSGDQVVFSGGSLPSGITAGTLYFAYPIDANTFKLSTTAGGSFLNTGMGNGSGAAYTAKSVCIKNCFRGFFFNSSDTAIPRVTITNGATITLMQLGWIFGTNNGLVESLEVIYNKPYVSASQPTAPASGDYWLDLTVNQWKKYSGTAWTSQQAILLGVEICDATACVGTRSFEFFTYYNALNTIEPEYQDTATIRTSKLSQQISVNGTTFNFANDSVRWSTATNLDSGESLTASTTYYAYISSLGVPFLSSMAPYQRRFDLLGDYHPHKPYRCIGQIATNGSSLLTSTSLTYFDYIQTRLPSSVIQAGMFGSGAIDSSLQLNSTGQLGIAPLAVAQTMRAASSYSQSLSCGVFTTSSLTPVFVTNLTASITTTGRPVYLGLMPDGSQTPTVSVVTCASGGGSSTIFYYLFYRDGYNISSSYFSNSCPTAGASNSVTVPAGSVFFIDKNAAAGAHTYHIKVSVDLVAMIASIQNCVLVAYEM